ncbi:GPI-anchored mannoprotein, partial [Sarracenia purpurea var. burkii]
LKKLKWFIACSLIAVRQKVEQFLNAARTGNLDLFKKLAVQLDDGKGLAQTVADVKDANKRGAFHFAAREGKTEVCKFLVKDLKLNVDTKDEDERFTFSALILLLRCPNLRSLRLNRAVSLERLPNLLCRAPQLIELGTGAYSAEYLKGLSGFWDVVPAYIPAVYSICSGLTCLNLSYATVESLELANLVSSCPNLQRLWLLEDRVVDEVGGLGAHASFDCITFVSRMGKRTS